MSVSPALEPSVRPMARPKFPPAQVGRRRRTRWVVLTALMLTAAITWHSGHRVDLGPAAGASLTGSAPTGPSDVATLRIGTFNIHGGKGLDNRRDLDRISGEIERLDLVGLNEVEGPFLLERQNQAEELATRLQLAWLFAPAERRWWHYDFGNGALTSLPVTCWQRIPLPCEYAKGFRNLVLLRTSIGRQPLNVVITHINRSNDRERTAQLRFVADFFLSLAEPAVLMGDLNSESNDPQMRRLLDSPGVVDSLAKVHGESCPRHIDWILVRGLEIRDAGMREPGPSDHPAVWAQIELPPASE